MQCDKCGKEQTSKQTKRGNDRLPRGWKRHEGVFCSACWHEWYILRAITFPVAGPLDRDWERLRNALKKCWAQSTALANWAFTELRKVDIQRTPEMQKLGPAPHPYLYPAARQFVPEMTPQSVVSILQAVDRKYGKNRLDLVWRAACSLPTARYPQPFPLHNQSWSARWLSDSERVPVVDCRLCGESFSLRLSSAGMRRQMGQFAQLVSGEAIQGEMVLYRQRANTNDNRIVVSDRPNGGGNTSRYRVMAKLVAWLPRTATPKRSGAMTLRTDKLAFWVAAVEDRAPWILNGDHIVRFIHAHERALDRLAHDQKWETRRNARSRRAINQRREVVCEKHHRRIDTWLHQATAWAAGLADRNNVAEVIYDDSVREYLESFPYHQLKERLATKLDERKILLTSVASGDVATKTRESLDQE